MNKEHLILEHFIYVDSALLAVFNVCCLSVRMTREAALDSQALVLIANIGRQKAQALNTEFVRFQPVEFAEKLVSINI